MPEARVKFLLSKNLFNSSFVTLGMVLFITKEEIMIIDLILYILSLIGVFCIPYIVKARGRRRK